MGIAVLQPGTVSFCTIADTLYIHDPYRHIVRPFLAADQRWLVPVLDALPNSDYV
jgi:hypothetical protein